MLFINSILQQHVFHNVVIAITFGKSVESGQGIKYCTFLIKNNSSLFPHITSRSNLINS